MPAQIRFPCQAVPGSVLVEALTGRLGRLAAFACPAPQDGGVGSSWPGPTTMRSHGLIGPQPTPPCPFSQLDGLFISAVNRSNASAQNLPLACRGQGTGLPAASRSGHSGARAGEVSIGPQTAMRLTRGHGFVPARHLSTSPLPPPAHNYSKGMNT